MLNAPIGICILDAGSLIAETVNAKFLEIAGRSSEAIVGKYYWDTFAEVRIPYETALPEVVEKGTTFDSTA